MFASGTCCGAPAIVQTTLPPVREADLALQHGLGFVLVSLEAHARPATFSSAYKQLGSRTSQELKTSWALLRP